MLATLSMRTPASPAVCETSLAALLKVARSLPQALLPLVVAPLFGCEDAELVAGVPKSDFKPSRLLRISID
jgi:hypothetical protein